MSSQQSGAWQTAGRPRHSHSASRTPQSRSGDASPSQQTQPSQPPKQESGRSQQKATNVWQRSSSASGSNGQEMTNSVVQEEIHQPLHGFNGVEVRAFLGREVGPVAYKPAEIAGSGRMSGAWGSKPSSMANNQPFFVQLAKQIATLEGGG